MTRTCMIFYRDVSAAGPDIAPTWRSSPSPHPEELQDARFTVPEFRVQGRRHRDGRGLTLHPPRGRRDAGAKSGGSSSARTSPARAPWLRDELGLLIEELEETCVKFEEAKERQSIATKKLAEKRCRQGGLAGSSACQSQTTPTRLRIGPDPPQPGCLGPDGRCHQRRLPHPLPRIEFQRAGTVSGLYVCEMVTARALVDATPSPCT